MAHPESDRVPRRGCAGMCWTCAGSAIPLCTAAPPCRADDAVQVVEVIGARAAAESAQLAKRRRDEVSDSLVADDIDKLPDISIADALQRIAGVQIGRDRGEGAGIVVRGLSQLETTLDGREVFTAGTARTLDFAELPAELVAGLDVIKNHQHWPTRPRHDANRRAMASRRGLGPVCRGEQHATAHDPGLVPDQRHRIAHARPCHRAPSSRHQRPRAHHLDQRPDLGVELRARHRRPHMVGRATMRHSCWGVQTRPQSAWVDDVLVSAAVTLRV